MNRKLIQRSSTIIVLVGLLLSQFVSYITVQAAGNPPSPVSVVLVMDPVAAGLPNHILSISTSETFTHAAQAKPNLYSDILFKLTSAYPLSNASVERIDCTTSAPIGFPYKLASHTYFWASNVGVVRLAVRKEPTGVIKTCFGFVPDKSLSGQTISLTAQVVVAKNGQFTTNPSAAAPNSNMATQPLPVAAQPILTSVDIAGPYVTNTTRTFHITVSNPANGAAFSSTLNNGLLLKYKLNNDGSTAPDIQTLQYKVNSGSWIDLSHNLTGVFSPVVGYDLSASGVLNISVNISFGNHSTHNFPFSLWLEDAQGNQIDAFSSVAALNITSPEIVTDLTSPYEAGFTQQFNVTAVNNPTTGGDFDDTYIKFTFDGVAQSALPVFQFYNTTWQNMAANGRFGPFTLDTGAHISTMIKFQIQFALPGTYTVHISLERADGSQLATSIIKVVEISAALPDLDLSSIALNSPFTDNTVQPFDVAINNPLTGSTYGSLNLSVAFTDLLPSDVALFGYSLNGGTLVPIVLSADGAGGSTGSINPSNWTLTPGQTITVHFQMNVITDGSYVVTFNLFNQTTKLTSQPAYFDVVGIPVTGGTVIYLPVLKH